jgi:CDP-paratose synthetase
MKIIISGANGFIGSHITRKFVEEGHNVMALIRPESDLKRIRDLNIETIVIKDFNDLVPKISKNIPDCLIYASGKLKPEPTTAEELQTMITANFELPTMLLYSANILKIPNYIHTSSALEDVFISGEKKQSTFPKNYYASTKKAFRPFLEYFSQFGNSHIVDLRLNTIFGENENRKNLIPSLIHSCLTKTPMTVHSPDQILYPLYIDDVTKSYLLALKFLLNLKKGMGSFDKFDIACVTPVTVKQIASVIENETNSHGYITFGNSAGDTQYIHYPNLMESNNILGWKPSVSLKEGIKRAILHIKQELPEK